jgi:DNA-binding response OmpR family regulator
MERLKHFNLLYVEDDIKTRNNCSETFHLLFKAIFTAKNYEEAISIYNQKFIDFILLDIELGDEKDGFDIANKIRETNLDVPIIFLTSYDDTKFVIKAINSNMNGYIVKPLILEEFINISNNVLKKLNISDIVKFKDFIYYFNTSQLFDVSGNNITLGKKENSLLQTFLQNKNKTLTREVLEYKIWNEPLISNGTLKNLIASLRKKIGKDTIINISHLGWKMDYV